MKYAKMLGLGLLALTLAVTGCTQSSTPPKDKGAAKADDKKGDDKKGDDKKGDHVHGNGPNGGITFAVGKDHAELTVDHPKNQITILFLKEVKGKKEKEWPPQAIAAKELTLTTLETKTKEGKVVPPMTIKMVPKDGTDGKASKFVGTDPGLGNVADFAGEVFGEIDGKPARGSYKE